MHAHLAAQIRQRSPLRLRPDSVPTDDVVELSMVLRLDSLELCSVHLDRALHAFAAGERLRRGNYGLRLDEYADQARVLLLGEHTSQLQDACSRGRPSCADPYLSQL